MSYIRKDFLLENKLAKKLYFQVAKDLPIFDYHCHLSEKEIFENKPFNDIFELWLKNDHYKWRLMRNYGISEEYITGSKTNKEKFIAYCKTIEKAIGNPLYHWSQLELEKYFNCNLEINEKNAEKIWEKANCYIKENKLTPSKLIVLSKVKCIFTTNHPLDDLNIFDEINAQNRGYNVFPAFRADALVNIDKESFFELCEKLSADTFDKYENAIVSRINDFVIHNTKAADISLTYVCNNFDREIAKKVFEKRIKNKVLSTEEKDNFIGYMTYFLAKEFKKANFTFEIHLGAKRDNNSRMFKLIGPDTGFDSISDANSIENLSILLNRLDSENLLPKIILFNLNKKMNTELLTLLGCFQDSSAKGKIQYGAAWWFLDNKVGMENHLKDLTSLSHLDSFIGMLTDSRSFLSYERHQYFRRILCNYIAGLANNGEATKDFGLLSEIVKNICYYNSINYFNL